MRCKNTDNKTNNKYLSTQLRDEILHFTSFHTHNNKLLNTLSLFTDMHLNKNLSCENIISLVVKVIIFPVAFNSKHGRTPASKLGVKILFGNWNKKSLYCCFNTSLRFYSFNNKRSKFRSRFLLYLIKSRDHHQPNGIPQNWVPFESTADNVDKLLTNKLTAILKINK